MKLHELCCPCPWRRRGGVDDGDAETPADSGWMSSIESGESLEAALLAQDYAEREGVLDASDVELLGKIGEGACGLVCRARVSGADAAVKCVDLRRHGDAAKVLRDVLKEAKLHASLRHERVVRLLGVAITGDRVLLAMERCEQSLWGLLRSDARLPGAARARALGDVAEGMAFLHARRVLHRDLKPENVLVRSYDEASGGIACVLADFGLSTNYPAVLARSNLTLTAMIGTPLYMAPELMVDARRVRYGASCDVYSFGVLGWSVWARRRPFRDAPYREMGAHGVLDAIRGGARPAFDRTAPGLLARTCAKCWGPRSKRPNFEEVLARVFKGDALALEWTAADAAVAALSGAAKAALRDAPRLSAGAEKLRALQDAERGRRAAMESAKGGDLAALVGWRAKLGSAPSGDAGLIIGVVKKKLLVRYESGREALVRPLLKPPPARPRLRYSYRGDRDEGVPLVLVERIAMF